MTFRRNISALALAFLLLGLQQLGFVHAFEHLRSKHEAGYALPPVAAEACAQCALLASGTDAVASSFAPAFATPGFVVPASTRFASRAVEAPAAYASRAPPVLP